MSYVGYYFTVAQVKPLGGLCVLNESVMYVRYNSYVAYRLGVCQDQSRR
jgi:hypothetical protein